MELINTQPIGVFDSGVGGLTVASAISAILPNEKIIYFGDTAHLPYGDKSSEAIRFYSTRIADFLLEQKCKIVIIACNTASAVANEAVIQHIENKALVMNVIDPVIDYIVEKQKHQRIGVIGTKATINSGAYPKRLIQKMAQIEVVSLATPLLTPMIEEGFVYDDISNAIIRSYLSNEKLKNIDALILGCTHYPVIKNQIRKFYGFQTSVIDSSKIVAASLKRLLTEKNLLNPQLTRPECDFFVSDYTEMFEKIAEMFFEEKIKLNFIDFWKQQQ